MNLETKICRRCRNPYMSEYAESEMCQKCENSVSIVKHGIRLKHCAYCDKPFEAKANNAKYCSEECKKEAYALIARERRRLEKRKKFYKCACCLKEFKPKHSNQKYCCEKCAMLAKEERKKIARKQQKISLMKEVLEKRPDLKAKKPKDKSYKLRKYIVRNYSNGGRLDGFERDYNYFKPCKFDENNENLYYIHDFNDSDLSSSLIKYTNTTLSDKEFEYYNVRGNLVFYEMLN